MNTQSQKVSMAEKIGYSLGIARLIWSSDDDDLSDKVLYGHIRSEGAIAGTVMLWRVSRMPLSILQWGYW